MRLVSFFIAALVALAAVAPVAAQAGGRPQAGEWVDGEYAFAFEDLATLATSGALELRRITVGGDRYEADELRDAYRAVVATSGPGAGRAFVATVEGHLADSYRANLEVAFPGAVVTPPTVEIDAATLAHASGGDPNEPPVEVALAAEVALGPEAFGIAGLTAEDVEELLDIGARLDVPMRFFADPGHQSRFSVSLPAHLAATSVAGAPLASIVETVDNRLGAAARSAAVTVRVASLEAPPPAPTRGSIDVVVDIQDLDVSIAEAAGGDFGTMVIGVTGTAELETVEIDEATARTLPPGVHIDSLDADGMRTLVALGLVEEAELDAASGALIERLGGRLARNLGGDDVELQGGFAEATFEQADGPVVLEIRGSIVRPLSGEVERGAALALYSITQSLVFERIEGLDTVYHVIFPPGLAAASATTDGGDVRTVHRADGRDEVVLTLAGEDAPDTATMEVQVAVTPSFVVAKFWPVVLLAAVVVVALVGGLAWVVVRGVRRK